MVKMAKRGVCAGIVQELEPKEDWLSYEEYPNTNITRHSRAEFSVH